MVKKKATFWSDFGIEVGPKGNVLNVFSEINFEKLGKNSMFKKGESKKLRFPIKFKK
tara:strand:- start:2127 stop:2297 length:171 start_codon:yes stop_codon:yes gene_type:complete